MTTCIYWLDNETNASYNVALECQYFIHVKKVAMHFFYIMSVP